MKKIFENIYEPQEDSQLLINTLNEELKILKKDNLKICEVGVGSGFVILNLAKIYSNNKFYATDINPYAIKYTKHEFEENKIPLKIKKTNLLDNINEEFDIILFNTPYLPCEDNEKYDELSYKDKAIYGGKHGYEVIEEFIYQIYNKLNKDSGLVYMLFSSQSNYEYIKNILKYNFYEFELIKDKRIFFENLYILKIKFSHILKQIKNYDIKKVRYFAKGKHSTILEGFYKNKKCIIKIGKEKDIQIENMFLEKLKSEKFMPKLYLYENEFTIREKLEGKTIKEFLENETNKKIIIKVLNECLEITQRLDQLQINKFEMTNPYKHIYINEKLEVKFIDFERCIYTQKPKNTTQFIQYLRRNKKILLQNNINLDEEKMLDISKKYKESNYKLSIQDFLTS